MAIKPILFNTEMVRAILGGRKTCTRRVIKPQWEECPTCKYVHNEYIYDKLAENVYCARCGYPLEPERRSPYQLGDILYVRETWERFECWNCEGDERGNCTKEPKKSVLDKTCGCYMYRATDEISGDAKWHPSIHMPKEAARIWLKVTDVRVERLQKIDEDGVWDEGFRFTPPCLTRVSADGHTCDLDGPCTSRIKYCDMTMEELFGRELWDKTIKKSDLDRYGWDANPWVWVIEFEQCEKPQEV
jgi:hypothetical protein